MNEPPDFSAVPRVLIVGDALVDHHVYEGQRLSAGETLQRGFNVRRQPGGARLIQDLFAAWKETLIVRLHKARETAVRAAEKNVKAAREDLNQATQDNKGTIPNIQELTKTVMAAEEELKAASQKLGAPIWVEDWSSEFGLTEPPLDALPCGHHALATWRPFRLEPTDEDSPMVWRAHTLLGFGHDEQPPPPGHSSGGVCPAHQPGPLPAASAPARILVLDDGGFIFRHQQQKACWSLPHPAAKAMPDWIVLKMSGPVAQGDLWTRLAEDYLAERLVCIVSAHELRRECVELSLGLSWERTVEDLHSALTGSFSDLAKRPRHLIVTLSADGALWLDNSDRKNPKATLVFDAAGAEGQWAQRFQGHGEAFGYLSAFTMAVLGALVTHMGAEAVKTKNAAKGGGTQVEGQPRPTPNAPPELSLTSAIAAGLAAMRNLRRGGHGPVGLDKPAGFPALRLAECILDGAGSFANMRVPWTDLEWKAVRERGLWRMVETSQVPFASPDRPSLHGLARQVVVHGPRAIQRLPHARFGKLLTADRTEIETLRTLRRLMIDYGKDRSAKKPLCIGVFGPPGAGKSFGVRELATDKTVFERTVWKEFNLSQFNGAADLIGAFHQIRDLVLGGATPVVFWDEFDSRGYEWLKYLLAPMQDGHFQEGQLTHPIGKCVFIFAGGTSPSFAEFGPPKGDKTAEAEFRLLKGPDFRSRLDAYYNVLGPNPRLLPLKPGSDMREDDPDDVCVPLRRAIFFRSKVGLRAETRLDVDLPLLDALLHVPRYRYGARSLEKLALALRPQREGDAIRRSALPPWSLVEMHTGDSEVSDTDPKLSSRFFKLLVPAERDEFRRPERIELLAEKIHESWRKLATEQGWKMRPHLDRNYRDLAEADKEDNRAAARRIPDVLALAGMTIETAPPAPTPVEISEQIRHHLDLLAEAEHDGWMDHKLKNGWTYTPTRDDATKRHHLLRPYAELPDSERNKDCDGVKNYPAHLALAGYRIIFEKSRSSLA